jgi:hypothetical protein
MGATSLDLSQIKTDALSSAATFRTLIGAGTSSFNGAYSSLSGIPSTFTPSSHTHSGSEITSGTVDPARLGSGTSITTKFLRGDSTWQTISGGGDALTTSPLSQFAATTSSQLAGVISDETGSGSLVFATSPTLVTPVLGTPTSGTLTNCTGYAYSNLTGTPSTFTPASHTHGNISNAGAIGSTANLPIITGTSGVLQAGSFGSTVNTFCQGNDSRLTTNLGYTASTRVLTSSTGSSATLPLFSSSDPGLVSGSGGGTTNFLRADGTWAAPPAGGSVAWGSITGTLSSQTDLNTALNNRLLLTGGTMTNAIVFDYGTITSKKLGVDIRQEWSEPSTVFSCIDIDAVDNNSASSSRFINFTDSAIQRAYIAKQGTFVSSNSVSSVGFANAASFGGDTGSNPTIFRGTQLVAIFDNAVTVGSTMYLGISSGTPAEGNADCRLFRDAADTFAFRRTTNPQAVRIYNTFTDSSNNERGILRWSSNNFDVGTEKNGTGSARAIRFLTDGTSRMSIASTGAVTIGAFTLPTGDGTNGQVLQTNGSGTVTWQTVSGGGGVSDGDKGDITVSASGATWTVDNDAITYAKIQNVSATDRLLGRSSAGSGDVEEITCTAAGRALLDDADADAQRTTLSAQKTITSGTAAPTGGADGDIYLQYT